MKTLICGLAALMAACASAVAQGNDGTEAPPPVVKDFEIRRNPALKGRKAFFYIDDVIWLFRDLTRQRPKSLFDNAFLSLLREAHERYGMKIQLNCFYRTDFFYGTDEFTLAEMTDAYRDEWQANKGWLRLGFHSLQEFPDYPFVNLDYADARKVIGGIAREVRRFAGEGVFARGAVTHWGVASKDTCRAAADEGIRILIAHCGPRRAWDGKEDALPYGHAWRFLNNRKPETALFTRYGAGEDIASSISGYNHFTMETGWRMFGKFDYAYDRETKIGLKELEDLQQIGAINIYEVAELPKMFKKVIGNEFITFGDHEQYFYKDYFHYQPDYAEKIFTCGKLLQDAGYEFFFLEELAADD